MPKHAGIQGRDSDKVGCAETLQGNLTLDFFWTFLFASTDTTRDREQHELATFARRG